MGLKQSKRSVDISGKEGEVAAAGGDVAAAGGEGRVESIADLDTLKPQVNGDTPHIEPPQLISDKDKQLENGTPENEKDATTEKETVVNGSGGDEDKQEENGDAKPASDAENNKKNKKEKVKKKWSFRSISFSRKDKPKQEKKPKDDEAKTNGDADKLPEEGTEATAEAAETMSTEIVKETTTKIEEVIEEKKTPETPVTEPITNGSSAPETPKEETIPKEAPVVEKPAEEKKPVEPEKLEINGLSIDDKEQKNEVKSAEIETKAEETPGPVSVELTSTPDIPVISEVCVGQSQVNEPTPPPLPDNPPPSSVTAFAETTMAPHVIETSLSPAPESDKPIIEEITSLITDLSSSSNLNENITEQPLKNDVDEKKTQEVNKSTESFPEDIIAKVDEEKIGEPKIVESVVSSESLTKTEVINDIANNEQEYSGKIKSGAEKNELSVSNLESSEFSELKKIANNEIESAPQIDAIKEELTINNTEKKSVTNGEKITTELIIKSPITNGTSDISEKVNGCSVESQSPVVESSNLDELSRPLLKPINLKENIEELVTRESEVEVLPPPITQASVEENGEENSNEEMSESFPLPPSELCPSSEASAAASPDHTQEATPVADITAKMSVAEISPGKAVVAPIQETAAAEVGSGAGDGAPSD